MPEPYVFISGRYGDYDGYLPIERRIGRAREHAAALALAGIPYFAAHLNSAHFEVVVPDVPRDFWLRLDHAFLERAAAVVVITEEHTESSGTLADITRAHELHTPVYFTEQLDTLIRDWPGMTRWRRAVTPGGGVRTFRLVSGVGVVAVGAMFPTGLVVTEPLSSTTGPVRSFNIYGNVSELEQVNGHNGATRIEWDAEPVDWRAEFTRIDEMVEGRPQPE